MVDVDRRGSACDVHSLHSDRCLRPRHHDGMTRRSSICHRSRMDHRTED